MNRKEFNEQILAQRIKKICDVLGSKADEYATDGSAFYNFERAADINRRSSKQELWSMATKQLVSILDMVVSDENFDPYYIDDKIADMLNYLILIEGIVKDSQ